MELFLKLRLFQSVAYCLIFLESIRFPTSYGNILGMKSFVLKEDSSYVPSVKGPFVFVTNSLGEITEATPINGSLDIPGGNNIKIRCRSRAPVQLLFWGLLPNALLSSETKIISQNIKNNQNFDYEVSVSFESRSEATGRYECTSYNSNEGKSVYIFANGNEPPYLLQAGKTLEALITGNRVIFPCLPTDSLIPIRLLRGEEDLTNDSRIKYDNKEGFSFDLEEFSLPYGLYKCSVMTLNETYSVHVFLKLETELSTRKNITLEFTSDSKIPTFKCVGATSMSYFKCDNPIECNFLKSCGKIRTQPCIEKASQDCSNYNEPNCRQIIKSPEDKGGIIYCSNDDPSAAKEMYFYTDLEGNVVTDISEKTLDFSSKKLILNSMPVEYGGWEHANDYYKEEKIWVNCNASRLFFGSEIKWAFQLNDGQVIEAETYNNSISDERSHYSKTSLIKFNDTRIVQLLCLSPKIYSDGWYNISQPIRISASYPPKLKNNEKNETFQFKLTNKNPEISCTATGLPTPSITWYKDGEEVTGSIPSRTIQYNFTHESILELKLTAADPPSVVYTCNATNFRASVLKNITVTRVDNFMNYLLTFIPIL